MNKTIAQRIRRIRQNRDLSQDNVADELGITKGAYSKIERGVTAISVDRLDQLSKIFDIGIHVFFQESNQQIVEDDKDRYGFATKGDIEELVKMLAVFRDELNNFKKGFNPETGFKPAGVKKAGKK